MGSNTATIALLAWYEAMGVAMGILQLADLAAKRSLGAPEVIVPLLMTAIQIPWIFAPALEPLLARVPPHVAFRRIGLFSNLPLLLIAFIVVEPLGAGGRGTGNLWLFVAALCAFYAIHTAYIPHRGALLSANVPPHVRGRIYGMWTAITLLSMVASSKLGGYLLDRDPRWLRVLFPACALLSIAGLFRLSRIRWRGWKRRHRERVRGAGAWAAFMNAWRDAFRILRHDRPFRTYEIGFMLYGFGFLMFVPQAVVYAEQDLELSYDAWTWARGVAFPVGIGLTAVFAGRLSDRFGVVRMTAAAFALLGGVFLSMPHVETETAVIVVWGVFGIVMAAVDVGWSLGPLHFAPEGRASAYAAVHFGLVGVRSVFAPGLGYLLKSGVSFTFACSVSALFAFGASLTVAVFVSRRGAG